MKTFIGTKIIQAKPMNRAEYNNFRGWTSPADEDGADDGYLVEYTDGGKPNVPGYAGYVSWSPKVQFDIAYVEVGDVVGIPPHMQRVVAEHAALKVNLNKLADFGLTETFQKLLESEQKDLSNQFWAMSLYSQILSKRINSFGKSA